MSSKMAAWLLIFLSFTPLFAQKGTITGKVSDKTSGKPLEFVNVFLKGTQIGASTNENGQFTLEAEGGNYTLVFSSIEYGTAEQDIVVLPGKTQTVNKTLETQAFNLAEMTVKSEGKFEKKFEEVTVTMEVMKPNLIQNRNAVNMDRALQQVPGVTIVDSEPQIRSGSGYSFGAGSRVMVLVDDMPILSGDAGRTTWGMVPVENVEQVEVIKGASSVLYGSSALNGVIHVRTTYPGLRPVTKFQMFTGYYDLPAGKDWTPSRPPIQTGFFATHMQTFGQFDVVLGVNALLENGYGGPTPNAATDPIDTVRPGMFDNRIRFHMNSRYRIKKVEGLSVGLNTIGLFSRSSSGFIGLNAQEGFYRFYDGTITRTNQTAYTLDPYVEYVGKKGSFHSLRTRFYSLNNANDNNQSNQSQVIYGEYQFRHRFVSEKAQNQSFLKDFQITAGVMTSNVFASSQIFNASGSGSDSQLNLAGYAQVENKFFNRRLTVSGGVRLEHFRLKDITETQPVFRGGATLRAMQATFIRASFGQGFRFPTIAERYIRTAVGPANIYPNPNLRPEKSWSAEVGIKQGFKIGESFKGYADVALYWQEYQDYVEFTAGLFGGTQPSIANLGFSSFNVGPARMRGVDFSIMGTGRLGKHWTLNVLAGYNYSLPEALRPDLVYAVDSVGNELSYLSTSSVVRQDGDSSATIMKYRFRHTVKFDAELFYKKFSIGGSFRFNSAMENIDFVFYTLDNLLFGYGLDQFRKERSGGDFVIDMRMSYQVTPSSKFSVVIGNILNHSYTLRPMYPEPPRSFVLQYALTL